MKETDLLEQFTVGAKLENWDTELLAGKESWVSWTDNNRKAIDVTHEYTVSHTHTHTHKHTKRVLALYFLSIQHTTVFVFWKYSLLCRHLKCKVVFLVALRLMSLCSAAVAIPPSQ